MGRRCERGGSHFPQKSKFVNFIKTSEIGLLSYCGLSQNISALDCDENRRAGFVILQKPLKRNILTEYGCINACLWR